jgi:6-phosphogluconolactonase/glucosamine-6-phosphate isomerase/deaminase
VAVDVAQMGTRRLTLTYPALCGAGEVCFLVTGPDKAAALATVVESGHLPAARIVRRAGPVTIFCDRDAASALTTGFLKK